MNENQHQRNQFELVTREKCRVGIIVCNAVLLADLGLCPTLGTLPEEEAQAWRAFAEEAKDAFWAACDNREGETPWELLSRGLEFLVLLQQHPGLGRLFTALCDQVGPSSGSGMALLEDDADVAANLGTPRGDTQAGPGDAVATETPPGAVADMGGPPHGGEAVGASNARPDPSGQTQLALAFIDRKKAEGQEREARLHLMPEPWIKAQLKRLEERAGLRMDGSPLNVVEKDADREMLVRLYEGAALARFEPQGPFVPDGVGGQVLELGKATSDHTLSKRLGTLCTLQSVLTFLAATREEVHNNGGGHLSERQKEALRALNADPAVALRLLEQLVEGTTLSLATAAQAAIDRRIDATMSKTNVESARKHPLVTAPDGSSKARFSRREQIAWSNGFESPAKLRKSETKAREDAALASKAATSAVRQSSLKRPLPPQGVGTAQKRKNFSAGGAKPRVDTAKGKRGGDGGKGNKHSGKPGDK